MKIRNNRLKTLIALAAVSGICVTMSLNYAAAWDEIPVQKQVRSIARPEEVQTKSYGPSVSGSPEPESVTGQAGVVSNAAAIPSRMNGEPPSVPAVVYTSDRVMEVVEKNIITQTPDGKTVTSVVRIPATRLLSEAEKSERLILREYQGTTDAEKKEELRTRLTTLLSDQFDASIKTAKDELKQLEERLSTAKENLETRIAKKEDIVDSRSRMLLGESDELAWDYDLARSVGGESSNRDVLLSSRAAYDVVGNIPVPNSTLAAIGDSAGMQVHPGELSPGNHASSLAQAVPQGRSLLKVLRKAMQIEKLMADVKNKEQLKLGGRYIVLIKKLFRIETATQEGKSSSEKELVMQAKIEAIGLLKDVHSQLVMLQEKRVSDSPESNEGHLNSSDSDADTPAERELLDALSESCSEIVSALHERR